MQAVIQIGSTQYFVEPGKELLVDHLSQPDKTLVFDKVLLIIDGDTVQIGQPYVKGTSVTAEPIGDFKGEKIRVAKFKAKSRYRKSVGFRAIYTRIKINSIGAVLETPVKSEAKTVRKVRSKKTV